jgi:hypothetical protein
MDFFSLSPRISSHELTDFAKAHLQSYFLAVSPSNILPAIYGFFYGTFIWIFFLFRRELAARIQNQR